LDSHGVFNDAWPLRPLTLSAPRLEAVANRFGGFTGAGGWVVSSATLANFLKQFPSSLQTAMAEYLEGITFLNRATITAATNDLLSEALREFPDREIGVIALTVRSGNLVKMLSEQEMRPLSDKLC